MPLPQLTKEQIKAALKEINWDELFPKHTGMQAMIGGCGTLLEPPNNRQVWYCPPGCPACVKDAESKRRSK